MVWPQLFSAWCGFWTNLGWIAVTESTSLTYAGACPWRALKVKIRTLKWALKLIGSQCDRIINAVICEYLDGSVRILTAVLWTTCRHSKEVFLRQVHRELHYLQCEGIFSYSAVLDATAEGFKLWNFLILHKNKNVDTTPPFLKNYFNFFFCFYSILSWASADCYSAVSSLFTILSLHLPNSPVTTSAAFLNQVLSYFLSFLAHSASYSFSSSLLQLPEGILISFSWPHLHQLRKRMGEGTHAHREGRKKEMTERRV